MGKSVATLQLLMGCCKTSSEADGRTDTTDDRPKLPAPLNHQSPVMDPIESSSSYDKENRSHPPASETDLRYEMKKYGYKQLAEVTCGFSDDNLLGEGGFGIVYKATLDGEDVAIKKLKRQLENKLAEIEYLSSVSHPNIVKMIGYCSEGKNRLLVLEFVPNNTLAYHLHVGKNKTLDWSTRMNIALQTANGLLYLHEGCKPSIIHRDIKADNILLDNNFKAKVADFSLSSFLDTRNVHHISSICRGTNVYADKEFGDGQKITDKLDVYSYGVILLELITGRKPLHEESNITIVQWAKNRIGQALNNNDHTRLVDSRLKEYKENEMLRMIYCAAASVYKPSSLRPNMNQIFRILQGTMRPEQIMKRKDIISLLDDVPQDAQMYKMKKYSFIELAEATNFFSNDYLLGEGAFGQVFRGILDGEVVAIKKVKGILNLENYLEDIEQLNIVSHPNIVKLIGYSVQGANRLLVSECVPNGSLEHHLHYARDTILDWSKRMKIATNSAKGLLHLHEGSRLKIIHGNIKAANILLDNDFEPKVADFMLAALFPNVDRVTHITSLLRGTNVYADPEYDNIQKISEKSDVYSFGVVLLELITGRRPIDKQGNNIINWAKDRIGQALNNNDYVGLVDSKLGELYDIEEIRKMICCAAVSIYKPALFRPRMKEIVEVLEGYMPLKSIGLNSTSISHLSSTLSQRKTWDVFISSRGNDDVRKGFLSHLLNALQQKYINTFVDNPLREGKEISSALLKIIEESSVAVVILSENYAGSAWCLDELVKILECKQALGQIVLPVFYGVHQSDVRKLRGSFEKVFRLTENLKDSLHKVDRWSHALREISNLSGWDSRYIQPDSKLIEEIVNDICKKLSHVLPSDFHNDNLEIYPTEESTS